MNKLFYNNFFKVSKNVGDQKQKGRLDRTDLTYYGSMCYLLIEDINNIESTF